MAIRFPKDVKPTYGGSTPTTPDRSKFAQFAVTAGFDQLAEGLGLMGKASESANMAFNYEQEASAALRDAKSALFMGKQKEQIARKQGAKLKGEQIVAQSQSGFVAKEGSNLTQIQRTEQEVGQVIADIRLSTTDKVNTLEFQAAMSDINSDLSRKIGKIQKETGIAKSVIGVVSAGYGAYNYGN